jgi:CRP/FNR family transcriptional regulator
LNPPTGTWHLHDCDLLSGLTPEEARELRGGAVCRDYAVGERIFAPQPRPQSVYLIEKGLARIYRLAESGAEVVLGYVTDGEVFGELSAFSERPRESFADAVHRSTIWKIPRELFERIVGGRAALAIRLTQQIGGRFKHIESRVENLVFRDVRSRLARVLLDLARDFGADGDGDSVRIELPLTQSELAKLIGSTRQSVNQAMRELEREGLVARRDGMLELLHSEVLRSLSGGEA